MSSPASSSAAAAPADSQSTASTQSTLPDPPRAASSTPQHEPICAIVIGMAGTGKTTLMQRLLHTTQSESVQSSYSINLDPAVSTSALPYAPNIDIRDTVNYKEVMKQYELGPNGGIMTSLNLFATRFDQVLTLLDKNKASRGDKLKYFFLDTPGQIEVFTWSASGVIITESLAASHPTCLLYILDCARCSASPISFMSNMLYACSILYKNDSLPFILVLNKTDVTSAETAKQWMSDMDSFLEALKQDAKTSGTGDSYMHSLTRSMALVLDEFYSSITCVGVSALTGEGIPQLLEALDDAKVKYAEQYKPRLLEKQQQRQKEDERLRAKAAERAKKNIAATRGEKVLVEGANRPTRHLAEEDDEARTGAPSEPHQLRSEFAASPQRFSMRLDEEDLEQAEREANADAGDDSQDDRSTGDEDSSSQGEQDSDLDAAYEDEHARRRDEVEFKEFMAKLSANRLDDADDEAEEADPKLNITIEAPTPAANK